MLLYRISKQKYISDLSGIGAKTVGGRWNPKGLSVLYTSTTIALATLEVLAHIPIAYFPNNMALATISVPDELITTIDIEKLPKDWHKVPGPIALHKIVTKWVEEDTSLGLRVPSTIVPQEYNVILNPLSSKYSALELLKTEVFSFDSRILK
ncbi:RES family NAD+ phosphorylase [Aquimarina brevivitae]|uniref:RES domain-containing protein n=1 Tax=Aquimarina brevivitae TaxID=323412 RepID=A0A4Q7NYL8_9FLAO|nr:RES family NAD+ phosphorylase [Aquimarina brevivitae]RZS92523.1 RES domain-containing protein [Aquimarina brevivitae]